MTSSTAAPVPPKVYRAMKVDPADGLPVIGHASSSELGVRPGIDISFDAAGDVVLDGSGMSVAPDWRVLELTRIPKRLRHLAPGAKGPNSVSCFSLGIGPFIKSPIASGLELLPDIGLLPIFHGVVAPTQIVSLGQYQINLENTRTAWQIDEA